MILTPPARSRPRSISYVLPYPFPLSPKNAVKSNQAQDLRNMGYYYGFKGYRFIRVPSQRISFTSTISSKT